jgi:hypothetical protein
MYGRHLGQEEDQGLRVPSVALRDREGGALGRGGGDCEVIER